MPEPDPQPEFRIERAREDGQVLLRLHGDLDLQSAPALHAAVDAERADGVQHVIVDLAELAFLDSSGVHAILRLHAAARADAFTLGLRPGVPKVQRVFEMAGLVKALPFEAPSSSQR